MKTRNLLIEADNVKALNWLLECSIRVDLIYIDPPFATGNTYKLNKTKGNTISQANGVIAYQDKFTLDNYLRFMYERLILMKELLHDHGSIYLHTDTKTSHYLKVLMDEIFGIENFRNDITRIKCNPKNFHMKRYGNIKDTILFYTKSDKFTWNEPYLPYTKQDIKRLFPKIENGRRYTTVPLHAPGEVKNPQKFRGMLPPEGRHWRTSVDKMVEWDKKGYIEWSSKGNPRKKIYADEQKGKRVQDIWEFKDPQYPIYPTEKNLDMLDLIIRTSSNTGQYVLDCFCGSGSTLIAAYKRRRYWIGIDNSPIAIMVALNRLKCRFEYFKLT